MLTMRQVFTLSFYFFLVSPVAALLAVIAWYGIVLFLGVVFPALAVGFAEAFDGFRQTYP